MPICVRQKVLAEKWPACAVVLDCYEQLMGQEKPNKMEVQAVRLLLETIEGISTGGERWGGDPLLSIAWEVQDRARGKPGSLLHRAASSPARTWL